MNKLIIMLISLCICGSAYAVVPYNELDWENNAETGSRDYIRGNDMTIDSLTVSGDVTISGDLTARNFFNADGTSVGLWSTDGTDVWRSTGNVGIGTTTPDALLDVNGNVSVDGNLSVGDVLMVQGSGNVGIGTASPEVILHIKAPLTSFGDIILKVEDSTNSNAYWAVGESTSTANSFIPTFDAVSDGSPGYGVHFVGRLTASSDTTDNLDRGGAIIFDGRRSNDAVLENANLFNFRSYGTSVMLINKDGNVGIGTTSPVGLLNIHSATGQNERIISTSADVSTPFTGLVDASLTYRFTNAWQANGGIAFQGFTDADKTPMFFSGHVGSASPAETAIVFNGYKSDGSDNRTAMTGTEKVLGVQTGDSTLMTVLANGNVGIGDAAPTAKLEVSGDLSAGDVLFVDQSTGNVGIGTSAPDAKLDVIGGLSVSANMTVGRSLQVGSAATYASFYREAGDIYSDSGKLYMGGGINAVTEWYGVGLQIRENALTKTLPYSGGVFTAAKAQYYNEGATFVTDGVMPGDFIIITGSTPDYTGACGEVLDVTESGVTISMAAAGAATPSDLTDCDAVFYNHPIVAILDNGDIHFSVGVSSDASFKIHAEESNNEHAVHIVSVAGVDSNAALEIDLSLNGMNAVAAIQTGINASTLVTGESATLFDVIIDRGINGLSATGGNFAVMDVALAGVGSFDEAVIIETGDNDIDIIHQHIGAGGTVDRTLLNLVTSVELTDSGINTAVLLADNDYIYIGSVAEFNRVEWVFGTPAGFSIFQTGATHEYYNGSWTALNVSDDTNGFQQNGAWRNFGNTSGWATVDPNSEGTSYYYLRVQRTRNNIGTVPEVNLVTVTSTSTDYHWDKIGDVNVRNLTTSSWITMGDSGAANNVIFRNNGGGDAEISLDSGGSWADIDTGAAQDIWQTIAGDSGSTAASSSTDTLTIAGGTAITTVMSGQTLTASLDTDEDMNWTGLQDFNLGVQMDSDLTVGGDIDLASLLTTSGGVGYYKGTELGGGGATPAGDIGTFQFNLDDSDLSGSGNLTTSDGVTVNYKGNELVTSKLIEVDITNGGLKLNEDGGDGDFLETDITNGGIKLKE